MPQWVIIWVASVIETIVAIGAYAGRNPRVSLIVSDWLARYARYCADKTLWLWQWVAQRYPDQIGLVDKNMFVSRVMTEGNQELFELMRYYGIDPTQARVFTEDLIFRVTQQLIQDILSGKAIPTNFPIPPNLPPWSW